MEKEKGTEMSDVRVGKIEQLTNGRTVAQDTVKQLQAICQEHRTEVARLTAEVERLKGEIAELRRGGVGATGQNSTNIEREGENG